MIEKRVLVGVQKSIHAPDIPCYLLIHSRGTVLHFSEWDTKKIVSLTDEKLPAGVIQIVLFDKEMNPLSERLIFNKNDDAIAAIEFQTDKETYQTREKVVTTLSFPDSLFHSNSGHFSIAVTDDKDIAVDESTTILSSLLLSSELRGYIENPAYYFQDDFAMELLMMTHGWRRYNVPEIAKGNIEYPQIPFQTFQEISGQVKTLSSDRPVPDGEILITMKGEGFGLISSDENGLFIVPELDFPDSATFYIHALNRKGYDNVRIIVDEESFPALVYASQTPPSQIPATKDEETNDKSDDVAFKEKAEQRTKSDEDIWELQLGEVAITAPNLMRKIEHRTQFFANASSDYTITRETIEEYKYSNLLNYFDLIPGVRTLGREPYLDFEISGMHGVGTVSIYIDGQEEDMEKKPFLYTLRPHDIESIDVFRFAGSSVFGVRGAAGIISITTRLGTAITEKEKHNQIVCTPLGYQKPAEFYSPKYETLEAKRSVIPDLRTTIYWKPDIVISEDGKVTFELYTSDFRATYSVVIEGITSDGRMVRQVEKINVDR